MASQAQTRANRANALKSTGPKTVEGKAATSHNAVKHGLLAEQVVIAGEDPGVFEVYREAMIEELSPFGAVETVLAERVVGLAWRLRRAERIQAEVFDTMLTKDARGAHLRKMAQLALPKAGKDGQAGSIEETALGRAVSADFANHRVLDRLGLYERRIERSFFKVMGELERLKAMRAFEQAEGTRGLRTHPTVTQGSKSEVRNSKFETNSNDQNSNDKNEENHCRGTRGLRTHPTVAQGDKSEVRNTKYETNTNDRNGMVALCQTKPIDSPETVSTEENVG